MTEQDRHPGLVMQVKVLFEETVHGKANLYAAADILAARMLPDVVNYAEVHNVDLETAVYATIKKEESHAKTG